MKHLPLSLSGAVVSLLLSSCTDDLLVGEKRCYGDGIECSSSAPTLEPPWDGSLPFDLTAHRVDPVWVYDPPIEFSGSTHQLAPAAGGGVWMSHASSSARELQRISAEGAPVESHLLAYDGTLAVDQDLNPVLLTLLNGHAIRSVLGSQGDVIEQPIGLEPIVSTNKEPTLNILLPGPAGRVRIARYNALDFHVAEYSSLGELLWKQTEFRGVLLPRATRSSYPYQAIALSDGAIALGLPKPGPRGSVNGLPPTPSGPWQGITLIGPDGNVRWDIALTMGLTTRQLMAPAHDGGVLFATGSSYSAEVFLIDGDGSAVTHWSGLRTGFHDAIPEALCADSADDVYILLRTGDKRTPLPTVCRMRGADPSAEVVCLGVAGAMQIESEDVSLTLGPMVAPEPGAAVFYLGELDVQSGEATSRLVRVEFEP